MPAAHGVSTQTIFPVEILFIVLIFRIPNGTDVFLLHIVSQNNARVCSLL
jgi:hypothetical protein